MSSRKYPNYRDSGVEWLGAVPQHWDVYRLKTRMALCTEKTDRRCNPVALENIEGWSGRFTATGSEFEGEGVAFQGGDLLFGKLRPYLAKVYLAEAAGEAVGDFHVLRPADSLDGRYAQYQMLNRSFIEIVDGSTFGSKMPRANWESLGGMPFAVPPHGEQTAIAAFLDRETAKIDALITEQEKLIALLAEKRQATISHAVTRGLDPDVPTKDSGVAWLGKVPAHWELIRIKRVTASIEQGWSPQCENFAVNSPEEWGVMKVGCVNGGTFQPSENKKLPPELEPLPAYSLKRGDLLVSRANTRVLVGSAAVVQADFDNLMLCDKLYRLRLIDELCMPSFLAAYLGTRQARSQIELEATGASSSMLNIGQAVVLDLLAPMPSLKEQEAILGFIDAETHRLGSLNAEAGRAVTLLKERRSALIAAAVTGQIDVRTAVPQPAQLDEFAADRAAEPHQLAREAQGAA